VYAFAQEHGIGEPEDFALRLARYFVDSQPAIRWARVSAEEYAWDRVEVDGVPAPHSFARAGRETRLVSVTYDGAQAWVVSGLADLVLLNTTGSEFRGYPRDRYTTLPETGDRVLATAVQARWRHAEAGGDWAASYADVRRHLVEAFAGTFSRSLQQTLYAMGERVLAHRPEVAEIRLTLPNRHHLLVDLAPFGLPNANETFVAADRPYGLIEGTVGRDGAPPAGDAW
jgi:urate oxidase